MVFYNKKRYFLQQFLTFWVNTNELQKNCLLFTIFRFYNLQKVTRWVFSLCLASDMRLTTISTALARVLKHFSANQNVHAQLNFCNICIEHNYFSVHLLVDGYNTRNYNILSNLVVIYRILTQQIFTNTTNP